MRHIYTRLLKQRKLKPVKRVLVFLHLESRRVFVTPATYHPNEAWVREQARAFVKHARQERLGADIVRTWPSHVLRNDTNTSPHGRFLTTDLILAQGGLEK